MSRISIGRLQFLLHTGIFICITLVLFVVYSIWHGALDRKKNIPDTKHLASAQSSQPQVDADLLLANPTMSWTKQESFTWKPPEPPSYDAIIPAISPVPPKVQNTSYLTVPIGKTTVPSKVELTVEEGTLPHKTYKGPSPPKFILLMSYMRSGSSLSAELLTQSEDTFYMFEPFWGIYGSRHRRPHSICSQDGQSTCTAPAGKDDSVEGTFFILKDLFNCRFKHLHPGILESFTLFYPNTAYNASLACFPKREGNQGSFIYWKILKTKMNPKCLELLEQMCLRTKVRLIKTIRLPLSFAETFFRLIPNLKIVHLVRDPRAVVQSRLAIDYLNEDTAEDHVKHLCNSMDEDLTETGWVSNSYKQRIILLFYDCLVLNPYQTAESLFHFLDLDYNRNTEAWVTRRMNSSSFLNEEFVKSGNVKELSLIWRSNISFPLVQMIDRVCEKVYEKLGLNKFPDASSVRNTHVSNLVDQSQCLDDAGLDEWINRNQNTAIKG